MKQTRFRKSGRCEQCNQKYRVRGDVQDHCSKNYKEWMDHNREVQQMGMGAEVCWYCFKYGTNPSIKADKDECKPENAVQNE